MCTARLCACALQYTLYGFQAVPGACARGVGIRISTSVTLIRMRIEIRNTGSRRFLALACVGLESESRAHTNIYGDLVQLAKALHVNHNAHAQSLHEILEITLHVITLMYYSYSDFGRACTCRICARHSLRIRISSLIV